jgi:hypothetical protein
MSHYLNIKCTALTDVKPEILKKALKKMNSEFNIESVDKFKNIATFNMDALLTISGVPSTIGFKFNVDNKDQIKMEVGGEFYGTGFKLGNFVNELCYNYSLILVDQMIKKNNYKTIKQKVDEDGTIHMTVKVAA